MGTAERKKREREQRQSTIINAAQKIFMEKGFEHTTMDDIAEAVELSKGALYFYFKSKAELCLSILLKNLEDLTSEFSDISGSNVNGFKKVQRLFSFYLNFHQENPQFINAVMNFRNHRVDCDKNNVILQAALTENDKINQTIANCLNCGKQDGSIYPDIEVETLAASLWGQLNGIMPSLILANNEHQEIYNKPKDLYGHTVSLILNAIKN